MTLWTVASCLIAFLVGGIPFGYLAGRLVLRDDIRRHGSGNIGATNVARVIGWKWGSIVLVLDALKGFLPTLAAAMLLPPVVGPASISLAKIAVGVSAIVGHMYPVWLRLRGGKGVATALGVVLVISPMATGAAMLVFAVVAVLSRIVGLASIAAAIGFAATQLTLSGRSGLDTDQLPLTVFSVVIPALIIWRHRANIVRLWRGEESVFHARTGKDE